MTPERPAAPSPSPSPSKRRADAWRRLDRLGSTQHGLVSAGQLQRLGFGPAARRWLEASGRVTRARRGVYRLCGVAPSWAGAALAAVLAAGDGAVVSHRSAAALWGLVDRGRGLGGLEITCGRQVRLAGVVAHRHRLERVEVTDRGGIPVTTVERTLLDLAETCDRTAIGRYIDEALRRRLTTTKRLWRAVAEHFGSGRRRTDAIRAALADRGVGYDPGANDWERLMDRTWERMGLPQAARQYRIRVAGGRSYRPDRAIVDARIAVDWNGFDPHGSRSSFDSDSDRRARLAEAGWFPLDFTSRSDPSLICRTVLAVYRERMASRR